jgi:hypothetical protein
MGLFDMMKKHLPHSVGVFPQGPARLGHGHTIAGEQNHHGFHHQREPRPDPGRAQGTSTVLVPDSSPPSTRGTQACR